MALTPDTVLRTDDAAGDSFLTFLTGGGDRAQGVAIINLNGDPMGVSGTPIVASISNNVSVDDSTPINVNIASTTHVHTHIVYGTAGAAVAAASISAVAATLVELRVILDPAATVDRYVMLFDNDGSTPPVTGATPIWRSYLPGASGIGESWGDIGLPFASGIYAAISSTADTLTTTSAEAYFHAISYT
jgi:hypothetical protein